MNSTELYESIPFVKELMQKEINLKQEYLEILNKKKSELDPNASNAWINAVAETYVDEEYPDLAPEINKLYTEIAAFRMAANLNSAAGLVSQYEREAKFNKTLEDREKRNKLEPAEDK
jgi:hypothetical protein